MIKCLFLKDFLTIFIHDVKFAEVKSFLSLCTLRNELNSPTGKFVDEIRAFENSKSLPQIGSYSVDNYIVCILNDGKLNFGSTMYFISSNLLQVINVITLYRYNTMHMKVSLCS